MKINKWLETVETLLEIIDRGVPDAAHEGSCGPWSRCDGTCTDRMRIGETVSGIKRQIEIEKKKKEERKHK